MNTIKGKITNIVYTPLMCSTLNEYSISELPRALRDASFLLLVDDTNKVAVSWWVSPKRTRSYPYARVYNTLSFSGKRITIIPIMKDEGYDGDRDYLQFDTIALMSLLNVHVIIAYYDSAEKSPRYVNKITNQRFDIDFLKKKIEMICKSQQSDALHWNMDELCNIDSIGRLSISKYESISQQLNVRMSNFQLAYDRIREISIGREEFLRISRIHAASAQHRESLTTQLGEVVDGTKAKITIENYLGGEYFFTTDETELVDGSLKLIEAKHSNSNNSLPSEADIKDGLIKMILYTNLENVTCNGGDVKVLSCLKLTNKNSNFSNLSESKSRLLRLLKDEANLNSFKIIHK